MKSIKAKVFFLTLFILVISFGFGYLAYRENRKMQWITEEINWNLANQIEINRLNTSKKKQQEELKKIMEYKERLPEHGDRRYALNQLIQAYKDKLPKKIYGERLNSFQKLEDYFIKVSQWKMKQHREWVKFYILLTVISALMGLFSLTRYLIKGVLAPLQSLARRMNEFLIDQYTFQFSSPPNNEIGNLERTFNSLAQKVLHNIHELHALDNAKSEFVSIASHELRTPLTSIKGSLGLLSNNIVGKLDQPAREMVLVAENETDRLVRIINDMLDLAKIESRSITLKKDWHSLSELFDKTSQSLQGFAWSAEVHFDIPPPPVKCEVFVDRDRVQQILTNLISNAIKYSSNGGVVTLTYKPVSESLIEVQVTDQGLGIPEESQKLIFEKFRQAGNFTNQLVKGTGLGLAISKALIEEHGGKIGVHSKVKQGSTFYFTLENWRACETDNKNIKVAA